jgi:hypothetical protein
MAPLWQNPPPGKNIFGGKTDRFPRLSRLKPEAVTFGTHFFQN